MGMTLRSLFFICMFSALHKAWNIDLSILIGAILFPKSWRKIRYDLSVLVLSLSLLLLLRDYESWRYWYPFEIHAEFSTIIAAGRGLFSAHISEVAIGDYHHFLQAILLGQKEHLDTETYELFRSLGIAHVLAISGFHIGFWVICMRPLFYWAKSPINRIWTLMVQFFILYSYAILVGGSASVLRAVWMFFFARFAAIRHSATSSLHFPMLVAIGHYFVNPQAPQSISFQLSYTAVFAILLVLKRNKAEQMLLQYSYKVNSSSGKWFFVPVQISLAAWSATLPLVQGTFGGSSPYFLAGNLLIVPLITFMIWAGIPLLTLGRVLPDCAKEWYAFAWKQVINAAERLLFFLEKLS